MPGKKKVGPLDLYPLLPQTNCGQCEAKVCMAFAAKLAERAASLEECPPIFEDKYKSNLEKLRELLKPPVREVVVGSGDRRAKLGGEVVLRRHEYRYMNPVLIAITVDDDLPEPEILKRVKWAMEFKYIYIGRELKLDMIAVRSTSGDPEKFESAVRTVAGATDAPLVLWSLDPKVLERGLSAADGKRPLIYAATRDNWKELADLALKHERIDAV